MNAFKIRLTSMSINKKGPIRIMWNSPFYMFSLCLLYFLYDGLKGFRIIHSKICKYLAVDLDSRFVQFPHKF